MATDNQLDFVGDIEKSVAAILLKNPEGKGVTIKEIVEMDDRTSGDFSGMVTRLGQKGEWTLLNRIDTALRKVGLSSQTLDAAIAKRNEVGEELRLENSIPEARKEVRSASDPGEGIRMTGKAKISVLTTILELLDPLPAPEQKKIGEQVMLWCGIGA